MKIWIETDVGSVRKSAKLRESAELSDVRSS